MLPVVPCRSTWGESCPIRLPAAPGRGVADVLAARLTAPDLDYPREGLRRRLNRMPRSATNSITAILLNQWPRLSPTRKERQMTIERSPGDERADAAGWPWSHRKDFLERLAAQGYAAVTIEEYRTISGRFCDAIEKRSLQIGDPD